MLRILKVKDKYNLIDTNFNIINTIDTLDNVKSIYKDYNKDRLHYFRLSTGSQQGNCDLIKFNDTLVLYDLGISYKRLTTMLSKYGITVDQITAVFISHMHADHYNQTAVRTFRDRLNIPVYTDGDTEDLNKLTRGIKFKSHGLDHGKLTSYALEFKIKKTKGSFVAFTDVGDLDKLKPKEYLHVFGEVNHDAKGITKNIADGAYVPKVMDRTKNEHLSKQKMLDWLELCNLTPEDVLPKHMSDNNLSSLEPFKDSDYYTFKVKPIKESKSTMTKGKIKNIIKNTILPEDKDNLIITALDDLPKEKSIVTNRKYSYGYIMHFKGDKKDQVGSVSLPYCSEETHLLHCLQSGIFAIKDIKVDRYDIYKYKEPWNHNYDAKGKELIYNIDDLRNMGLEYAAVNDTHLSVLKYLEEKGLNNARD